MKKLLWLFLAISLLLACSNADEEYLPVVMNSTGGETIEDGLAWYDVVMPAETKPEASGWVSGSYVKFEDIRNENGDFVSDGEILAYIEFDDENDLVGAKRGDIADGEQVDLKYFGHEIRKGYTMKVSKGSGLSPDQWTEILRSNNVSSGDVMIWVGVNDGVTHSSRGFNYAFMTGHEIIPIGSELAILDVYNNEECEGTPLGQFKLVL